MSSKKAEAPPAPKLVVLNRAFKLAEQWVNNMSGTLEDESCEVDFESRPPRLGIGATAPPESKFKSWNEIERRLLAKLSGRKRKADKGTEESNPSAVAGAGDDDDSDDDFKSKCDVFTKRRPVSHPPSKQNAKKKLK